MAPLPKGPYTVSIDITTTVGTQILLHTLTLNCAAVGSPPPGTPAASIQLATRSGATIALPTAVNDIWNLYRALLSSAGSAGSNATLWRYDGPGVGDTFISAVALTTPAGAAAGGPNPGHETTLTFRTGLGRIMKIEAQEDTGTGKGQAPLLANAAGNFYERIAAYCMSASGWIAGRGGTWPITPLRVSQTYNEHTENERFRT